MHTTFVNGTQKAYPTVQFRVLLRVVSSSYHIILYIYCVLSFIFHLSYLYIVKKLKIGSEGTDREQYQIDPVIKYF